LCSPTERKELFAAIPFSYGTLGFLTAVDIDIIPYKPYIELTYHNVQTLDEVVDKFTEVTNDTTVDSVEGIMFTLNTGVIMSGKFVEKVPRGSNYNALRWYKPWFYKHVETFMNQDSAAKGSIVTENFNFENFDEKFLDFFEK
jgi:delta24-sterol reductase